MSEDQEGRESIKGQVSDLVWFTRQPHTAGGHDRENELCRSVNLEIRCREGERVSVSQTFFSEFKVALVQK